MNQKLVKVIGGVIAGFILLFIIIFIIASCSHRKLNYSDIENDMIKAAKSYYQNKQSDLPQADQDQVTIRLKELINNNYMNDPAKKYKNKNLSCDGYVTVTNNNNYYLYSPSLTCGKDYKTSLLKDKIIDDNLVEDGVGLYEIKNQYIFKGETGNNYLTMNGRNYRIIRINDDGTIRLYEVDGLQDQTWDDRFNTVRQSNDGINDYKIKGNEVNSRIKEIIQKYYENTESWPDTIKSYITTQNLCIGKRSENDITKDGSIECSEILSEQQLGLLAVYEYMQASLDNSCTSTNSTSCSNYNWFSSMKTRSWLVTADKDTTHKVYYLNNTLILTNANNLKNVNVVFNISDKAVYAGGDGTEANPYKFK